MEKYVSSVFLKVSHCHSRCMDDAEQHDVQVGATEMFSGLKNSVLVVVASESAINLPMYSTSGLLDLCYFRHSIHFHLVLSVLCVNLWTNL